MAFPIAKTILLSINHQYQYTISITVAAAIANKVHVSINHFACNFAKCSPTLKILSPADCMINV